MKLLRFMYNVPKSMSKLFIKKSKLKLNVLSIFHVCTIFTFKFTASSTVRCKSDLIQFEDFLWNNADKVMNFN